MEKFEEKYLLTCKECGFMFLPWRTLMVTLPQNDMKPFVYCPQCKNYDAIDNFKKD